jgi:glutaminase
MNRADRFKLLCRRLKDLANKRVGFNQAVFLSEKDTANRNYALAYYMKSMGGFPSDLAIDETLDFYFQCCSIDVDCEKLATVASTYANHGVNPFTDRRILKFENVSGQIPGVNTDLTLLQVKRTMQLMFTAGVYDFSGEWANTVGLPAKRLVSSWSDSIYLLTQSFSGVSGGLYAVVPGVCGMAVHSPSLDCHGNSARGVEFCTKIATEMKWNIFDVIYNLP